MLIPNHPDDERLSALASGETDATADATLTDHVSSCRRCTDLVTELGALRAALADLPDLAPSRPLQLIPPVEAAPAGTADRLGGWARRFFAPVLASGAALALVGTIGTAAPSLSGMGGGQAGSAQSEAAQALELPASVSAPSDAAGGAAEGAASNAPHEFAASAAPAGAAQDPQASGETRSAEDLSTPPGADAGDVTAVEEPSGEPSTLELEDSDEASREALTAERSPWPMVLFSGVALMIAALLLRWILVPRAG